MTVQADWLRALQHHVRGLGAEDTSARREAARALFDAVRQGEVLDGAEHALVAAARDADSHIRRHARLALVVWALVRAETLEDERVVVLDALSRDEALAAEILEPAWPDWEQVGVLLKHLVPLGARAIQLPGERLVRAGLDALHRAAGLSYSLDSAIAPLGWLLDAAPAGVPLDRVLRVVLRVTANRQDIGAASEALVAVVDGEDEELAWIASQALGRHLALTGDGDEVDRLLTHPSVGVRQGTAEALQLAAHAAVDLEFAMPSLNSAALDEAGGVSYYALRAIHEAAFRGADVTPAREALEVWSVRSSYSTEGWYPYLYHEDASDLGGEHPGREARDAMRFGKQNLRG